MLTGGSPGIFSSTAAYHYKFKISIRISLGIELKDLRKWKMKFKISSLTGPPCSSYAPILALGQGNIARRLCLHLLKPQLEQR